MGPKQQLLSARSGFKSAGVRIDGRKVRLAFKYVNAVL